MTSLARLTVVRVINPIPCTFLQKRNIAGKALRDSLPPVVKPRPFDYVNKDYTWFRSIFDKTTRRFDQNTKVIVVEGPVACGKTELAKALAEDLNMKHFPEANMDIHYCRPEGVDLRIFNDRVPEDVRCFDHVDFNRNPKDRLSAAFQLQMYVARYGQYIDALAHVLNTGQGVVLERSPYSDFVFLEAMFSQNFISKGARSVYYELRHNTLDELMRPHLVIYLDVPVEGVTKAIKKRNKEYEVSGKALNAGFLAEMERLYKDKYLRDISTHAELLIYDWSGGGEVEVVVEDIERLDFDDSKRLHRDETKFKDWRLILEQDWGVQRMLYTNQKHYLMNLFGIPRLDVPELITSAEDDMEKQRVYDSHPALEYAPGYERGKSGLLFKSNTTKYTEHL